MKVSIMAIEINGYTIQPGADLRFADLSGADLSNMDLSDIDFRGANLTNANLSGSNLHYASLGYYGVSTQYEYVEAKNTDLSGADLSNISFYGDGTASGVPGVAYVHLRGGFDFSVVADLSGADFSNMDLSNTSFDGLDLTGVNFKSATLDNASFENSNLSGADFGGAVVTNVNWFGANIDGANFYNAGYMSDMPVSIENGYMNLYGSVGSYVMDEDFSVANSGSGSTLSASREVNGYTIQPGADLQFADLSGADLSNMDLSDIDFRNSNLSGADFGGTVVTNVNWFGANIDGANFYNAVYVSDMPVIIDNGYIFAGSVGSYVMDEDFSVAAVNSEEDSDLITPDFLGTNTSAILDNWLSVHGESLAQASDGTGTLSMMQTVDGSIALLSDESILAVGDVDVDDVNSSGEVYWDIWFNSLGSGVGGWNRETGTQDVLSLTENGVRFNLDEHKDDAAFNELLLRFAPPEDVDLTGTVAENFDFPGVAYIQSEIWYNDFDGDGEYSTYERAKFIPSDDTGESDWDNKVSVEDRNGQLIMKDADYNDIGISWVSNELYNDLTPPDFLGTNTSAILDNWLSVHGESLAQASDGTGTLSMMQTVDGSIALLSDESILAVGDVDVDDVNSSGEVYWDIWFNSLGSGVGGWNRETGTQDVLSLTENGVRFNLDEHKDDAAFNELLLRFAPPEDVDLTGTVAENFDFPGVAYIQSEIWYNDFDGDGEYSTYERAKFIPSDDTGESDWDNKVSVEDRNGQLIMKDADYNDIGISWVSNELYNDLTPPDFLGTNTSAILDNLLSVHGESLAQASDGTGTLSMMQTVDGSIALLSDESILAVGDVDVDDVNSSGEVYWDIWFNSLGSGVGGWNRETGTQDVLSLTENGVRFNLDEHKDDAAFNELLLRFAPPEDVDLTGTVAENFDFPGVAYIQSEIWYNDFDGDGEYSTYERAKFIPSDDTGESDWDNKVSVEDRNGQLIMKDADYNDIGISWVSNELMGDNTIIGTDGNDELYGFSGDDTINGMGGDDWLYGGVGDDIIDGGAGFDRIDFRESASSVVVDFSAGTAAGAAIGSDKISNIERVIGSNFDDTLIGSTTDDDVWESFTGGLGDDIIDGAGGNDYVWYGRSNAGIQVDLETGIVTGGEGEDQLTSIEWVAGSNFADILLGSEGDDGFSPDALGDDGAGSNFKVGGTDIIDGKGGIDTVSYNNTRTDDGFSPSGIVANLTVGEVTDPAGNVDKLSNIENINGSAYNDNIIGDHNANILRGIDGDDILSGGSGNDTLDGGSGNDTLSGGAGDDVYEYWGYEGFDVISETSGFDTIVFKEAHNENAGWGSPFQEGDDLVYVAGNGISGFRVTDHFSDPDKSIELFEYELSGYSVLVRNSDQEIVDPFGNYDELLVGTVGNDTIIGAAGDNIIHDEIYGYGGDDTIDNSVGGKSWIEAGDGDDVVTGGASEDRIRGQGGDDKLSGNDGNDYLFGGAGDDTLDGGAGNDTLTGGAGDDIIYGGAGDDTYVFEFQGNDTVIDSSGNNIVFADTKGDNGELRFRQLYQSNDQLVLEGSRENTDSKISMSGVESIKWGVIDDGYTMTLGVSGETSDVSNSMYVGTLSDDTLITGQGDYVEGYGADGDDTITVLGGSSWVSGDGGNDTLIGGEGNDTLKGDYTSGDAGHDTLYGNGGNDTLSGNAGNDTLTGGSGSDTFQFHGFFEHDTITDYDSDEDILEFYANDGSALNISDLIETVNSDGNRVLSTADGLSSVTLEGTGGITPVSGGLAMSVVSQDGDVVTFGIFADPITDPDEDGIGSFDFTLNHDASDMQIDAGSLVFATGLSGLQNYDADSGTLTAGAFTLNNVEDLDAPLLTFEATMLDTKAPISIQITDIVVDGDDFASTTEVFDFSALAITTTITDRFGNAMTSAEAQAYEDSVNEITATSTTGNVTVFETASGSDLLIDAAMAIDTASDKAIGAFDALQALRLAVGLDKSDGTSEWHDYIAADINKDGRVGADDALNILKFAVGLTDGPSADWVFVDGDADYSEVDRKNTNYDEGILISDVMTDLSINMTGILVGDVDGSYIA